MRPTPWAAQAHGVSVVPLLSAGLGIMWPSAPTGVAHHPYVAGIVHGVDTALAEAGK